MGSARLPKKKIDSSWDEVAVFTGTEFFCSVIVSPFRFMKDGSILA